MAAGDLCPNSRRLFVTDKTTKQKFLIDTGADLCIYPSQLLQGRRTKSAYELFAANNSVIATYGFVSLTVNFGLRRDFTWRFVVAGVSKPIIGADFLAHYGLLVDIRNKRLVDSVTTLSTNGHEEGANEILHIRAISDTMNFHWLLAKFPEITHLAGMPKEPKHTTYHHINTTPGPPTSCKPRRLAPEKLRLAKAEFEEMQKMGIVRPSKSN